MLSQAQTEAIDNVRLDISAVLHLLQAVPSDKGWEIRASEIYDALTESTHELKEAFLVR